MSGPVTTVDAPPTTQTSAVAPPCVEVTPAREALVGAIRVRRVTFPSPLCATFTLSR